jgi:hypothetical protein
MTLECHDIGLLRAKLAERDAAIKELVEAIKKACEVGGTYDCESQGCLARPILEQALAHAQAQHKEEK